MHLAHLGALHVRGLGALPGRFLLWALIGSRRGWRTLWVGLAVAVAGIAVSGSPNRRSGGHAWGPFEDFDAYGAVFYRFFFPALFRYLGLRHAERPDLAPARL